MPRVSSPRFEFGCFDDDTFAIRARRRTRAGELHSPTKFLGPLFQSPRKIPHKIEHPVRKDARLAALWVGHATVLIQIEDKLVLTDPVFGQTIGQLWKRLVEPGLELENVPKLDVVLISHMHFDHLSFGSLADLESRIGTLVVPQGGHAYLGNFSFPSVELERWESWEHDGLRITAVPVKHVGQRYGVDNAWMTTSYTGYVIEYRGVTVYFGGDSAWGDHYRKTARRFPKIDLAILPIAPIEPRGFMSRTHVDPPEAIRAFLTLGARWMVPIHYDTFANSQDDPGDAVRSLRRTMQKKGLADDRVTILDFGQQRVFLARSEAPLGQSRSVEQVRPKP